MSGVAAVPPRIFEATAILGPPGTVFKLAEIDEARAVARRRSGLDVVVCGPNVRENHDLARKIESAVGPCIRHKPHSNLGSGALPHFQPVDRPPEGHTFYESGKKFKARKSP